MDWLYFYPMFTLSYFEGCELPPKPKDGYDTIQSCIDWADANGVDYYLLCVTEWDNETKDAYGTGEIVAQVNLQAVVNDEERESLTKYQTW